MSILARLDKGQKVPDAVIPAPLAPLFRTEVQDYLANLLKQEPADRAADIATYRDPALPIAPAVVEAVTEFVKP